ncbi:SAM-dependent methyltransferase [Endozoicomonas sp. YOMI1]|uniref:SAM-dependent methyltransferase n=1 Tax=Endozoicomonas sp. YOMI1 TaxID=2828739 RepID=UPI00214931BB|nr:SAM-dependent methyltransferase [Endozoicomonas sp. YOMI1]
MSDATTHQAGSASQTIPDVLSEHCATASVQPLQTVALCNRSSGFITESSGLEERHTKHIKDYSIRTLEPALTIPKLSRRLNKLVQLASDFNIIWDMGCDHGKTGIALAAHNASREVHCIDCSKHVITRLQSLQLPTNLTTACVDAATVKIHNCKGELVILAGMGSHTANKIIDGILSDTGDYQASFLVSIHRNHDDTVAHLASRYGFSTTQHCEVEEKKKTYRFDLMSPQHGHS